MAGGLRLDALLIGSGPPDATGGARRQLLVNQSIGEQQRQRLAEQEAQLQQQQYRVKSEQDVNATAMQLARMAKAAWEKLPPEQRTGPIAERNWRGLATQVTAQIQRLHPETAQDFRPEDFTPEIVDSLVAMGQAGVKHYNPQRIQMGDKTYLAQFNEQGGPPVIQGEAPAAYNFGQDVEGYVLRRNPADGRIERLDPAALGGSPQPMPQPSRIGQPPPGNLPPPPSQPDPNAGPVNFDFRNGISPEDRAALQADMAAHRQGVAPNPAAGTAQVQSYNTPNQRRKEAELSAAERSKKAIEDYRQGKRKEMADYTASKQTQITTDGEGNYNVTNKQDGTSIPVTSPGGEPMKASSSKMPGGVKEELASREAVIQEAAKVASMLDTDPKAGNHVGLSVGGLAWDWLANRWDEDGVDLRSKIANIKSLTIKDRSGAAVTVGEMAVLRPFLPNTSDEPKVIKTKLKGLAEFLSGRNNAVRKEFGQDVQESEQPAKPSAKQWKAGDTRVHPQTGQTLTFDGERWR